MELNMKKKLLCCALLAGLSMAQAAAAQDYDSRWYLSAGAGVLMADDDRGTNDEWFPTIGLGKFISPRVSIDAELWHTNMVIQGTGPERNWELTNLSVVGRYYFFKEHREWQPYLALGLGAQHHRDETLTSVSSRRTGTVVGGNLGAGVQTDIGYANMRFEVGGRWDFDNEGASGDNYVDRYAQVQFLFPLGAEAAPAPEPVAAPPAKTCADLDDDGDGVNNCDDKCSGSVAGQAIGPDGCPLPAAPEPEPAPEPKPFRG
jgi:OOP family OmpA-OmpF porin